MKKEGDESIEKKVLKKKELKKRLKKEIAPFTLETLPLSIDNDEDLFDKKYLFQKILGAGAYGVVVAAVDRAHLEQCAIKIISKSDNEMEVLEQYNLEARILEKVEHPSIVKLLRFHESIYHYFIVMERLQAGTLADFILERKRQKKPLTEAECRILLIQLLEGLEYLHSQNLLHRDLKPANILMKSFYNIEKSLKIADFGLCTELPSQSFRNPTERCGTRCYMAPEQIQGKSYYKGVDIWATGIIMFVLLSGKHPFYHSADKTTQVVKKMMNPRWRHKISCSKFAKDLMYKLCNPDVIFRYSASEALKHPWITENLNYEKPITSLERNLQFNLQVIGRAVAYIAILAQDKEEKIIQGSILQGEKRIVRVISENTQYLSVNIIKLDGSPNLQLKDQKGSKSRPKNFQYQGSFNTPKKGKYIQEGINPRTTRSHDRNKGFHSPTKPTFKLTNQVWQTPNNLVEEGSFFQEKKEVKKVNPYKIPLHSTFYSSHGTDSPILPPLKKSSRIQKEIIVRSVKKWAFNNNNK